MKDVMLSVAQSAVTLDKLIADFEDIWDFAEYDCVHFDLVKNRFVNFDIVLRQLRTEMEACSKYLENKDHN